MSSIIALTSFFTAILFYLIYKEKLYLRHLFGMLSLLACLVFIAVSKQTNISIDAITHKTQDIEEAPLIIPILFALLQCIYFTFGSLIFRIAFLRGYTTMQFSADFQFISGLIYLYLYGKEVFIDQREYESSVFWYVVLSGIIIQIALVCQNFALKHGKGGLSQAIIQS